MRMEKINGGLESKTTEKKFNVERRIQELKGELKRMKLEEH